MRSLKKGLSVAALGCFAYLEIVHVHSLLKSVNARNLCVFPLNNLDKKINLKVTHAEK